MSGVSDLFSGIGNLFNDLTHPGTGATTPASQPADASPNAMLLIVAAVALYLILK